MNLIGNNCASAFVYKYMNIQYNNPFMWNRIWPESFFKLITRFTRINFRNITFPTKLPLTGIKLTLDNDIEIDFQHACHTSSKETHTNEANVYVDKPWEYVYNKWFTRLERMKERPTFLMADSNSTIHINYDNPSKSIIHRLNNESIPWQIIWVTRQDVTTSDFSNLNLTIVKTDNFVVQNVARLLIEHNYI